MRETAPWELTKLPLCWHLRHQRGEVRCLLPRGHTDCHLGIKVSEPSDQILRNPPVYSWVALPAELNKPTQLEFFEDIDYPLVGHWSFFDIERLYDMPFMASTRNLHLRMFDQQIVHIEESTTPEQMFGIPSGTMDLWEHVQKMFIAYSKTIHPDMVSNRNKKRATAAFAHMSEMKLLAERLIANGRYGSPPPTAVITSKRNRFEVYDKVGSHGVATAYKAIVNHGMDGVFTIANHPTDNDLMENEAKALVALRKVDDDRAASYLNMLPEIIDSVDVKEANGRVRRANVFKSRPDGWVTLSEVIRAYPDGLDPRDMAWMFRRLLDILGYAHGRGIIHGQVTPDNILIGLGDIHEVCLVNWQAAIINPDDKSRIKIIDPKFKSLYPREVLEKEVPGPWTDLYMLARSLNQLNNATWHSRIRGFLQSCYLPDPRQRSRDAWKLRQEFTSLIDTLWGKREYRPLALPNRRN